MRSCLVTLIESVNKRTWKFQISINLDGEKNSAKMRNAPNSKEVTSIAGDNTLNTPAHKLVLFDHSLICFILFLFRLVYNTTAKFHNKYFMNEFMSRSASDTISDNYNGITIQPSLFGLSRYVRFDIFTFHNRLREPWLSETSAFFY